MHVVTGGAFNGKSAWVREYYQFDLIKVRWIDAYKGDELLTDIENLNNLVVIEGVEHWILQWLDKMDIDEIRKYGRRVIEQWKKWEQQQMERQLIIIGTDISKGIVPMDATMRKWRDVTGWFYQDLVDQAERVDLIWYGIAKQLK